MNITKRSVKLGASMKEQYPLGLFFIDRFRKAGNRDNSVQNIQSMVMPDTTEVHRKNSN